MVFQSSDWLRAVLILLFSVLIKTPANRKWRVVGGVCKTGRQVSIWRQTVAVGRSMGGEGATGWKKLLGYLSVLWGMVGSMDTIAPLESSSDRLVFLHHQNKHTFTTGKNNNKNNPKHANDSNNADNATATGRSNLYN